MSVVGTYTICLVCSLQLTYIVTIRGRMRKLILENFTLFNKMEEGLIVLSEENYRIQFASRPAVSLIKYSSEHDFEARQLRGSLYDNLSDSKEGIGLKFCDL